MLFWFRLFSGAFANVGPVIDATLASTFTAIISCLMNEDKMHA